MGVGPFEILIVVAVLLLIIGPRRVTDMTKSLGRGVSDFVSEIGNKKDNDDGPSALGGGDDDSEDEDRKPPKAPEDR